MKKLFLVITSFLFIGVAYGGGIVTNTNQSAYWVRTMVRDAAIGPDGVYFNPAGLTKLNDGFHFSLNTQTIFQSKDVENDYTYLKPSPKKYFGDVKVPVFPSLYATWKKNKIAISFGFNPIGGGGGATFEDGLPSMEQSIADMVPTLAAYGASEYHREVYFKGTSVYKGYQLGVTYQINDVVSAYLGARYVSVKNTYEGYLRNVQVNMNGTWSNVSDVFTSLATQASAGAAGADNISGTMGALIGGGLPGTYTLAQAEGAGAITATQRTTIEAGLTQMSISTALTLAELQTQTSTKADEYEASAAQATASAQLTEALFNQVADVTQKGAGIAPIIGLNLNFEKLNIGIKYEFKTRIQVENETESDFILDVVGTTPVTMFHDGDKIDSDVPAMLALGLDYKITPKFSATAGLHYYWDKSARYGKKVNGEQVKNSELIDNNYIEIGAGFEYGITDKLFASVGYLLAKTGVSEDYQSDISFSLTSNSFCGGLGYKLTDKIMINAGALYSAYNKQSRDYTHKFKTSSTTSVQIPTKDTYYKNTLILGLGVDFSF
jgi:long-chain fatty acid transport protein